MPIPGITISTANDVLFADLIAAQRADDWATLNDATRNGLLTLGTIYLNDNIDWAAFPLDADGDDIIPVEVQRAQCWAALHVQRNPDYNEPAAETTGFRIGPISGQSQPAKRPRVPRHIVDAIGCWGQLRRIRHHVRFP